MKPDTPSQFRRRLLAVAACPLGVAAAAAVACPESLTVTAVAGAAFAAVAGALAWTLTRPLAELVGTVRTAAGDESSAGLPVGRRDELGTVAAAFADLVELLNETKRKLAAANALQADTVEKFTAALEAVGAAVGRVAAGTTATPLSLSLPDGVSGEAITAACTDLNAKVNGVRQRLAGLTRVFQACPLPIVATDERGTIRFTNTVGEHVLGRPLAQLVRSPLGNFLRPPAETDPTGLPSLVLTGVPDWLAQGGRAAVAEAGSRGVRLALSAGKSAVPGDTMWCVVGRDLADDHRRLGADRARTREEVLTAVLALAERQAGAAGEVITAQARQLICEAKQTPQRDALVPRLKVIRDTAAHLDSQARLARWLSVALWGDLPAPAPAEFLAGESVRSVIDLLGVRLKEADVTVNVSDAGGWLYCDEEWFGTAVLGVLTHATAATRGAPVGVRLRRLPCLPGQSEGNLEVEVVDAGQPLTPEQAMALTRPLGELAPSALLPTGDGEGFLPGLLVARKLAAALGGELSFDATASGRLIVRMVVPTRLPDRSESVGVGSHEPGEAVAVEELCIGWRLGMSS